MNYVVGTNHNWGKTKYIRTCSVCGVLLFFTDNWDWNKVKPICMGCSRKIKDKEYHISEETIRKSMLRMGKSREEIMEIFNAVKRGELDEW